MRTETQAAVLCGGRGERLKPLTDYFQKVMIPIGPKKLPLLEYVIRLITRHGIRKVALLTGYRSEDIRRYFGDGSHHGVELAYSKDQRRAKGSLNAVASALRNGVITKCDELLVYYGDVLTNLDITRMVAVHRKTRADATLVLARGYTLPVGTAEVTEGRVTDFREKPRLDLDVATGCMIVGPRSMSMMRRIASAKNTDLMTHFLPRLLRAGGRVTAFYTDEEWYDVGTVSSFQKLNDELGQHPLGHLA